MKYENCTKYDFSYVTLVAEQVDILRGDLS